jgi:outer membrane murein-binding lipoprotein Lpp
MKLKQIALAVIAIGTTSLAGAADNNRIAQLEAQLKAMQAQIEELKNLQKTQVTAQKAEISELKKAQKEEITQLQDQVVAQGKEAVVIGDLPNSYRLANGDTSIRVYGIAEFNMIHETRGSNADMDYSTFMPYAPLRGSADAARKGQTYMHARTSRLGIEAATPTQYGQLVGKIEGDFNNDPRTGNSAVYGSLGNIYTQQATNSYNFRLRHAYLQLAGWTVGQTWSTFMDLDATPEVVDFNGPIGGTFIRQPQIRYTYATPNYGNFSAAIENSVSYVLDPTGSATKAGFSKSPDLIVRWDKAFTQGSLSLRAVSHEHRVEGEMQINSTTNAMVNESRRGYGVSLSGVYRMTDSDQLSFIATGGEGIGRYFNYIEGAGYNANTNQITMEKAAGLVVGYQHKYSETLRLNLVYGGQRNFDNSYTDWARANGLDSGRFGVNRKVQQLHIGTIWNPVKYVDIGAEYIYGRRETLAGERGDMSRFNLMARYNFN